MKQLIKQLVKAYGPAGDESEIRSLIKEKIKPAVDELKVDTMGNLIAFKKGTSSEQTVMLAAHMDEIGLIATHIDEDGFIRFSNVGGVSPYNLLGERVIFNGETIGVIDKEGQLDKISKLKHDKMYIDIGTSSQEETEKKVTIGDTAVYYRGFNDLGERITAKSLDDRVGCAALIKTLQMIEKPAYDTYFVFTVQEEVGIRGAKVSAYGIEPDIGIAVDVTLTGDMPEAKRMAVSLGEGAAIKVKDSSVLVNKKLKDLMVATAEDNQIPYQLEVLTRGGTDAGSIQLTREGVIAGAISIPARYVHSPSEMIDMNDLQYVRKLTSKLLTDQIKKL